LVDHLFLMSASVAAMATRAIPNARMMPPKLYPESDVMVAGPSTTSDAVVPLEFPTPLHPPNVVRGAELDAVTLSIEDGGTYTSVELPPATLPELGPSLYETESGPAASITTPG
jgi:hypothetical protein